MNAKQANAPAILAPTTILILPATIGAELQGGIYVGPSFDAETGKVDHLIAGEYLDDGDYDDVQAAAAECRAEGFNDWRAPTKFEAMAAAIHAGKHFKLGWHWTSTPYGSGSAWFVGFEGGMGGRNGEFRFRPFRSLTA